MANWESKEVIMARMVNSILKVVYPMLVFGTVLLAWDLSGQAELAHLVSPLGDGIVFLDPSLSVRSSCDQKDEKFFQLLKKCSVR
jgi:hypothetical protein